MCGIVGIAGDISHKLKASFPDLLMVNQVRGRDATGAFTVSCTDIVNHAKAVGTPDYLLDTKSFDEVMRLSPKVMVGHCRAKTMGGNTRNNAHPYDFDNVIGVHNGTLRGYSQLEGYDSSGTDSQALYYNIDRYGVEETFAKLDPAGAWALVWWDKNEKTLNFLRNKERPLWFAWTKDKSAMLWASEPGMFWAAYRNEPLWDGSSTNEAGDEVHQSPYFQLPVDELWSFSVDGFARGKNTPMTLHAIRKIEATGEPAFKVVGYHGPGVGGYKPPAIIPASEGGSVASPFSPTYGSLDDPLDDVGTPSQDGSGTLGSSAIRSGRTSSILSDTREGRTHGTNSSNNILSLPQRSSNRWARTRKDVVLGASGGRPSTTLIKSGISLRTLCGIDYITDNRTGIEFPTKVFEEKTGGCCSFCKEPIGDLSDVHEFIGPTQGANRSSKFICKSCVIETPAVSVG